MKFLMLTMKIKKNTFLLLLIQTFFLLFLTNTLEAEQFVRTEDINPPEKIKRYSKLWKEPFGQVNIEQMRIMYINTLKNISDPENFKLHWILPKAKAKFLEGICDELPDCLEGVVVAFGIFGYYEAQTTLQMFLNKYSNNFEVNLRKLFSKNYYLTKRIKKIIIKNIIKGYSRGIIKIPNSAWDDEQYGWAYGIIDLHWEIVGDMYIVFRFNDLYSFQLEVTNKKKIVRWTHPLYEQAALKVLTNKACDYYIVGKTWYYINGFLGKINFNNNEDEGGNTVKTGVVGRTGYGNGGGK